MLLFPKEQKRRLIFIMEKTKGKNIAVLGNLAFHVIHLPTHFHHIGPVLLLKPQDEVPLMVAFVTLLSRTVLVVRILLTVSRGMLGSLMLNLIVVLNKI